MKCFASSLSLVVLLMAVVSGQSVVRTVTGSDGDRLGASVSIGAFDRRPAVLAAGAPAHDPGAAPLSGRVRVIAPNGAVLATFLGGPSEEFGAAVALGADFDADGRQDLVVGAPGTASGLGRVLIVSGATRAVIRTIDGTAPGGRFGATVAILGDVTGDAIPDLAIGAPLAGTTSAGEGAVSVHSGASGLVVWSAAGVGANAALGHALAAVGDVDGDGFEDLAVGAPGATVLSAALAGEVTLYSGATGTVLRQAGGAASGDAFGSALARGGDLDADGFQNLLIGAPSQDGVAGVDAGAVHVLRLANFSPTLVLEGSAAGANFGAAISGGFDIDRDGRPDFAVGAPGFDGAAGIDSGRVSLHSAPSGALRFAIEGLAAGDREGAAISNGAAFNDDAVVDVATAAPDALAGGAAARGRIQVLESDTLATARVDFYAAATAPRRVVEGDLDGDGDLDLVVLGTSSVSIHWNGDATGSATKAAFGARSRTLLSLSAGADGSSLAVGQLDADLALEIVVGRSDGTVDLFDGSGSLATTSFALTTSSPVLVDSGVVPGAINALVVFGSGASAEVLCAGQGAPFADPSFVARLVTPLTAPSVLGPVVSGGSFTDLALVDLDGDLTPEVLASNADSGSSGGVHVLVAPSFSPAVGSPFATGGAQPLAVAGIDLDGDLIADDVAIAAIGFGTGGVRLLTNYLPGTGFSSVIDLGLANALDVAAIDFDSAGGQDLVILSGLGAVSVASAWNGAAFAATASIDLEGRAGAAVLAAQLSSSAHPLNTDEIVSVHLASDQISVYCAYLSEARTPIANTGFPPGASTAAISLATDAVLGTLINDIQLTGATPFAPVFLTVQELSVLGTPPVVSMVSGAGIAIQAGDFRQYFTFTDLTGTARLASGLPDRPELIGIEVVLQWGILDGGPVQSAITPSDALLVRFGEI